MASQTTNHCSQCGAANTSCGCWGYITTTTGGGSFSTATWATPGIVYYGPGTATSAAMQQPVSYKSYEELEYDRLTRLEDWMNKSSGGVEVRFGKPAYWPLWKRLLFCSRKYWVVQTHRHTEATIEEAEEILAKRVEGNWTIVGSSVVKDSSCWYFYLEPIREN